MAKIGIYGGSFNPVHFGHVGLARWVIEHTDLDELWLMVSPNNPLKPAGILAPEEERLAGVQQAIKDIPGLKACDFEFHLPRPSYTANTLRELQKAYPEHEFTLIMGEDNIAIFDRWREYEYILENFRIFVYPRKGEKSILNSQFLAPQGHDYFSILNSPNVTFLEGAPLFDISSSAIRHSQGRP
ncbi:MAG: nicotinate (nicotinamide) nucleotide adenylyltransferase [Paludibacteraceae bacterium]|nr:nicotinate (nicotinamide) nucleotide adenylyltransferase [Paludibacteraceae bacterium]